MNVQSLIDFIQSNIPNMMVQKENAEQIASLFEEMNFDKNEYLLKQGKISGYYYLADGYMRSYTYDADGKEITTYFHKPGKVVFEPSSFFQHLPSTENIQAITPCTGYYTNFKNLNGLFHSVPEFREFGRAMLVKEFVAYKQQTLAIINKNAEERYTDLLANNPEIFQYAQLKHIASFLGITDTSLSRIRREFAGK